MSDYYDPCSFRFVPPLQCRLAKPCSVLVATFNMFFFHGQRDCVESYKLPEFVVIVRCGLVRGCVLREVYNLGVSTSIPIPTIYSDHSPSFQVSTCFLVEVDNNSHQVCRATKQALFPMSRRHLRTHSCSQLRRLMSPLSEVLVPSAGAPLLVHLRLAVLPYQRPRLPAVIPLLAKPEESRT